LLVFKLMTSTEQQAQDKFDHIPKYLTLEGGGGDLRSLSHIFTHCDSLLLRTGRRLKIAGFPDFDVRLYF
jgi:hypothetical protein